MITAPIALAFTAGMVATFNPCGFSLLPAYIGVFVAGDRTGERVDRRLMRALVVAAAVSVGFVIVFATVGLIIDSIASEARRQLPWITIVLGGLLIVGGMATVAGWKPRLTIVAPNVGGGRGRAGAMVGYGATYAIASLSCTIGPFLAVTGAALSQSPIEGIATYVAYALGMGSIILALSVASSMAHSSVANHLRRLSRVAPRLGGALMVLAGGYAIWYGRWELAVYDGNLATDPLIDTMEDVRLWIVNLVEGLGAGPILFLVAVVGSATVYLTRRGRTAKIAPAGAEGPEATPDLSSDSPKEPYHSQAIETGPPRGRPAGQASSTHALGHGRAGRRRWGRSIHRIQGRVA